MKLIYHPNPILEQELKTVDIENIDFDPKELKDEMVDLMYKNDGIGLAASQVGIDKKLFVMSTQERDQSIICINPTILQYTEETERDLEGCLSFPDVLVEVKRPKEVLVAFNDENLEEQVFKMEGYMARVYLHELDHTLGITFKNRVSRVRWSMAQRRAKKYRKLGT